MKNINFIDPISLLPMPDNLLNEDMLAIRQALDMLSSESVFRRFILTWSDAERLATIIGFRRNGDGVYCKIRITPEFASDYQAFKGIEEIFEDSYKKALSAQL